MSWPVSEFEVHAWRRGHGPRREYATRSAADLLNEITAEGGPFFLEVLAIDRDWLGVAKLWLNADGMAWVRLKDAQGGNYYHPDPSRAGMTGEVGNFFDDTAGPFAVPAASVITARQAVAALAHWLSRIDVDVTLPAIS